MACISRILIATIVALVAPFAAAAQSGPAFEVASVRLTPPGTRGSQRVTDTRVDLINVQLRAVLLMAFRARDYQLVSPDWTNNVRVDIVATLPAGAKRAEVPDMLQTLLVERFGLVTRVEPRPVKAYDLVVAGGGPKMVEVEPLDELDSEAPRGPSGQPPISSVSETVDGTVRNFVVGVGFRTLTARTSYDRQYTTQRTSILDAARMTMAELARVLTSNLDEPVIDRTGLSGIYRFKIELPPDATALRLMQGAGINATVQGTPLNEPTGVSTFKAVEGLGLRLERRKSPVDVVVVERMERAPSAN